MTDTIKIEHSSCGPSISRPNPSLRPGRGTGLLGRAVSCSLLTSLILLTGLIAGKAEARAQDSLYASCVPYIVEAEKHYDIPPRLLMAISLAESGRDGQPHPWTLNIKGSPKYYDTLSEAADSLVHARKGTTNIDVGCMQVNLTWHERGDPRNMLIPRNNVWYAADFLATLRERHGSWTKAVARYHAGAKNIKAQRRYLCSVWKHWKKLHGQTAGKCAG